MTNYAKSKSKLHKVSLWCFRCRGTGYFRKRQTRGNYLDPRITIENCKKCNGRGRLWYIPDTPEYKMAKNIIKGLWPRSNEKFNVRK